MTTSYRLLTPADLPLLRSLIEVFAEAFDDRETYLGAPPSDAYLGELLGRRHVAVVVALRAGEVVGGLVAYELEKLEQERREVYIYDLAVAEPHRRQGIATGLIAELQRLARRRGAWVIFVQADYGDEPAIRLYESLGRREEVLHFDIAVDAP